MGDIHGPFEDKRSVKLAFDIMKHLGVNTLILNGDVADFYNLNSHGPKDPQIETFLQDEFHWLDKFLDECTKNFDEVIYIFGNHEFRLDRFVMANCPAFWNFLALEKMMRLEERGIKFIPYNERFRIQQSNLFVQHSPPSYSENLAGTSLKKKIDECHIWNCAHRTDFAVRTGSSGKVYKSYINGWFGSKGIIFENQTRMPDNKRVFHFTKNHESWNCSFSLISAPVPEKAFVQQVLIENYEACVGRIFYRG